MRKVISIDGAHLTSKFKGTLLAASAQDGNFNLYFIAFAIVDSENDASWDWFLKCLLNIIPDENDLVFVSDRAASIASGVIAPQNGRIFGVGGISTRERGESSAASALANTRNRRFGDSPDRANNNMESEDADPDKDGVDPVNEDADEALDGEDEAGGTTF
ncbi:hypothetical protein AXX17_AT5G28250 [Arabidopsis thaliana]|uniref:MULE transposase domain-containing protein n=1 Tax=Arabidopsis thaliana TaxID=3702 RepID=A0A178UH88_ARATH|nr:hypothetical protein AXX17_AT5G28250 [Arabidopsis thaliana]